MPTDIVEMFWGCLSCKADNKGRFKTCQNCGAPRTSASPEWMPDDVSPMAAVRDADLLHKFKGGEDWKCKYCGSSQYRVDGSCAQCGSEQGDSTGAKVSERIDNAPKPEVTPDPFPKKTPPRKEAPKTPLPVAADSPDLEEPLPFLPRWRPSPGLIWGVLGTLLVGTILYFVFRTKIVDASVSSVSWERAVAVERYKVWVREGWDPDFQAFDIHNEGQRIHHYDHVRVGSHTEHYTERVACGQDCSTTPRTCRTTPRNCTSNKNGSATCTGGDTVCTGGDRVCTTKYCNAPRTRTVDDYEDQPRYRTWYSWHVWDWGPQRVVRVSGSTTDTFWPSDQQIGLNAAISQGEKERESGRTEHFEVKLFDGGDYYTYTPKNDGDFKRFTPGSKYRLKVGVAHGVEVLPP